MWTITQDGVASSYYHFRKTLQGHVHKYQAHF